MINYFFGSNNRRGVDIKVVSGLKDMLDQSNVLMENFRMVGDCFEMDTVSDV